MKLKKLVSGTIMVSIILTSSVSAYAQGSATSACEKIKIRQEKVAQAVLSVYDLQNKVEDAEAKRHRDNGNDVTIGLAAIVPLLYSLYYGIRFVDSPKQVDLKLLISFTAYEILTWAVAISGGELVKEDDAKLKSIRVKLETLRDSIAQEKSRLNALSVKYDCL